MSLALSSKIGRASLSPCLPFHFHIVDRNLFEIIESLLHVQRVTRAAFCSVQLMHKPLLLFLHAHSRHFHDIS